MEIPQALLSEPPGSVAQERGLHPGIRRRWHAESKHWPLRCPWLIHSLVQAPHPVTDQGEELATSTVRGTTLDKGLQEEGELDQKEGVRCKKEE